MDEIERSKKRIDNYRSDIKELERVSNVKLAETFKERYDNNNYDIEDIIDKQAYLSSLCKELIDIGNRINDLLKKLQSEESYVRDLIRKRDCRNKSIDRYLDVDDYKDIIDKLGMLNAYKL